MLLELMIELVCVMGEIVFEGLLELGVDFILDWLPERRLKSK